MSSNGEVALSTASFSLRIEGDSEIRAGLLAQILSGFSESVFLLSKEHHEFQGSYLAVSVIKPGSVDVIFKAAVDASQIALPFIAQNASTIIGTVKGMLEIKKLLKGDKPKKVDVSPDAGYITVEAKDGSKVTAPLGSKIVISNPRVDKAIASVCEATKIHNPRAGFWFNYENEQEYFSADDIQDIALLQTIPDAQASDNVRVSRVTLLIKSLDLLGGLSWQFRHAGRTITAKIIDPAYMRSVHSGSVVYKAGDSLDVDLEITEIRSPSGEILQERYLITKVHGHQVQTELPG